MRFNWSKSSLLRDFALLSTLIIFVLGLVTLWVTYETYEDQSQRIVHQLETESTRIDRAMILEIEHSSYLLQSLGRQISHMDVHDLNSIALLLRSFDTTATLHNVFSWIDENQNNVVSSNKGVHLKPVDVSDRDFVKKAIAEPWKIQIGRPIQGRVSSKWVLPIAMGLTDTTGKYIGTILISMDIGTITRNLHNAVKEPGISFTVYSTTLLPLTEAIEDESLPPLEAYSEQLRNVNFTAHPSGVLSTGSLFDERSMYVYYEVSANYPYIILVGYDSKTSNGSIRDLLIPRLIQIFLMGTFMVGLLWVVRLRIIIPVSQLTEMAAGILRGEPYRGLPGSGTAEVYALAQQLKRLSDYLKESHRIGEEKESKNLSLRKGKDAAELSNKIKIEFLTAMSHELRTPLNTIVGFSEIMKNQLYGPLENTQYWQYAQDIHEAAQHLQALIDDVLALSNAESAMLETQEKPVDVRFVLNKCLRLISERLAEQKLHVELKMPDVMPRLLVDETRLKQIIINLIINAANHSMENNHILVETYTEKDKNGNESFCISFVDFGSKGTVRMNNPSLSKISNKPLRKSELSNLGIPLTKALVAMQQATLEVKSPPGAPTSVILRFPQERMVY
jgi:signal transduction histidine kinase